MICSALPGKGCLMSASHKVLNEDMALAKPSATYRFIDRVVALRVDSKQIISPTLI